MTPILVSVVCSEGSARLSSAVPGSRRKKKDFNSFESLSINTAGILT